MSQISPTSLNFRKATLKLCEPLEYDDHLIQSAEFVSPPKWHLAHTSWFFETFLLGRYLADYRPFDEAFAYLFNSYYESLGERVARPRRGSVSRPTLERVREYRAYVDEHLAKLYSENPGAPVTTLAELGRNHEEQHQELLLMDIKHILFQNPARPAYFAEKAGAAAASPLRWHPFGEKLAHIGYKGDGFAFDNELPRHPVFLAPYSLASRPVTNGEFLEFIQDGGYRTARWWLSDGWDAVARNQWKAPLYWEERDGEWTVFTFYGQHSLDPHAPVAHVSGYEAHAYAQWKRARLPTEAEWETAMAASSSDFGTGQVWEWTNSAFSPYPGYRAPEGALGEYNGKFMSNQWVLRGAAAETPAGHSRVTYRNFYPLEARWQFSGFRLAKDNL